LAAAVSGLKGNLFAQFPRLERDGLITRTMYLAIRPRVEYELTKLGRSLLTPITGLGDWASQNRERIPTAREKYDAQISKS